MTVLVTHSSERPRHHTGSENVPVAATRSSITKVKTSEKPAATRSEENVVDAANGSNGRRKRFDLRYLSRGYDRNYKPLRGCLAIKRFPGKNEYS